MRNNNDIMHEIVACLETIKEDAQMALNGTWDCTTEEGRETGFGAQIVMIDKLLSELEKE